MKRDPRRNGKEPLAGLVNSQPVQDQINALVARNATLSREFGELRQQVSPTAIKQQIDTLDRAEVTRLEKLRDDIVDLCQLLIRKNLVTQDELNEAIGVKSDGE